MTVKISPIFNDAQLDASGNPWSGAKLFTYAAGSSTKTTTYQDSAGATPHANPIVLNSRGEPPAPIWLTSGVTYKFVLTSPTDTDPPVSATRTVDNVSGTNDTTVTLDQWVAGPAPTFIGTTSFSLVGDQTSTFHVGRRLKTTNSGGTIYSTISVSAYTTLTTLTVVNDSGVLDSGLSAVSYGLLTATNISTPWVFAAATQAAARTAIGLGTSAVVDIFIKRKTADESVSSADTGTTLQDDDHLTFPIGANEEWVAEFSLTFGNAMSAHGLKMAVTTPSGAAQLTTMTGVGNGAGDSRMNRSATPGDTLTITTAEFPSSLLASVKVQVWVLNGATPGNVTLQFAQNTSHATPLVNNKGSYMIAHRVA